MSRYSPARGTTARAGVPGSATRKCSSARADDKPLIRQRAAVTQTRQSHFLMLTSRRCAEPDLTVDNTANSSVVPVRRLQSLRVPGLAQLTHQHSLRGFWLQAIQLLACWRVEQPPSNDWAVVIDFDTAFFLCDRSAYILRKFGFTFRVDLKPIALGLVTSEILRCHCRPILRSIFLRSENRSQSWNMVCRSLRVKLSALAERAPV